MILASMCTYEKPKAIQLKYIIIRYQLVNGSNLHGTLILHCTCICRFTVPIIEEIWEKLPDLPAQEVTCTSFCNELIVVGGVANKVAVSDICHYNEQYRCWEVIGYLPHPRYRHFTVGLWDKLIVIGGLKDDANSEDTVAC